VTALTMPCTRCGLRPRVPKQRWCLACRSEYKRLARGTPRGTAGNGTKTAAHALSADPGGSKAERVVQPRQAPSEKSRPVPTPAAPYVPFTGSGTPRAAWYAAFLSDLAINGGISLAAAAAGVHRSLVYRRISEDPAFAAEVEVAKAYYRDLLEWESVNLARRKDNPLPYFARLKAELPARYIDRQAVLLGTVPSLDPEDGRELLRAMLDAPAVTLEAAGPDPARVVLDSEPSGPPAPDASA
jgi:hypothetical protein